MSHQKRWIGFVLVITGAVLWGVGGSISQWLFQNAHLPVGWFVSVRLLVSGVLLILISALTKGKSVFYIWGDRRSRFQIIIYGVLGMLAVQYTFMSSIHYGNAAVATLLQYLGPVIIIIYMVATKATRFRLKEGVAVVLALLGSYLLLTNGKPSGLSVPAPAIVWGLLSAVALAFYTVYPTKLLARWGSLSVVGWAMFIGGFVLSVIHPPWAIDTSTWSVTVVVMLFLAIIFGTMLAFWFYIDSLNYLFPQETSLLGTIEPLTALVVSIIWLHVSFGIWQFVGVICIISMVVVLSLNGKRTVKE